MEQGYFTVRRGPHDVHTDHAYSDDVIYYREGDQVKFTGTIAHWSRQGRFDKGTWVVRGFDGKVHASVEDASRAWETAGRPAIQEPTNWIAPRYATE